MGGQIRTWQSDGSIISDDVAQCESSFIAIKDFSGLHLWGCLGLLCSTFFSSAPCFLAKRFQLHALSSRKKNRVVRAPKEVLYKLQFFVELLHGGVYGAKFVEQSQTPPI